MLTPRPKGCKGPADNSSSPTRHCVLMMEERGAWCQPDGAVSSFSAQRRASDRPPEQPHPDVIPASTAERWLQPVLRPPVSNATLTQRKCRQLPGATL